MTSNINRIPFVDVDSVYVSPFENYYCHLKLTFIAQIGNHFEYKWETKNKKIFWTYNRWDHHSWLNPKTKLFEKLQVNNCYIINVRQDKNLPDTNTQMIVENILWCTNYN